MSYALKQNLIYLGLILLTSICTIIIFHLTQQDLIILNKAEKKFVKKDFKNAVDLYEKSLELGVSITEVGPNLASAYVALNKFNEALPVYRLYLRQNPHDVRVRLQYAKVLAWLGLYREAEIESQKLVKEQKK